MIWSCTSVLKHRRRLRSGHQTPAPHKPIWMRSLRKPHGAHPTALVRNTLSLPREQPEPHAQPGRTTCNQLQTTKPALSRSPMSASPLKPTPPPLNKQSQGPSPKPAHPLGSSPSSSSSPPLPSLPFCSFLNAII